MSENFSESEEFDVNENEEEYEAMRMHFQSDGSIIEEDDKHIEVIPEKTLVFYSEKGKPYKGYLRDPISALHIKENEYQFLANKGKGMSERNFVKVDKDKEMILDKRFKDKKKQIKNWNDYIRFLHVGTHFRTYND
jgi:hypothetical protein